MISEASFSPDWVAPPGATLKSLLLRNQISMTDFASEIGLDFEELKQIISGETPIGEKLASIFAGYFSPPAIFWIEREKNYRNRIVEVSGDEDIEKEKNWASLFPLKDMIKFGWLNDGVKKISDQSVLEFFGVSSLSAWENRYSGLTQSVDFRTSFSFNSEPFSTLAWLRQGELSANLIPCKKFDTKVLESKVSKMRALAKYGKPEIYIPKLKELCAECGVAFVITPTPKGCPSSGATRMLSNEKAILQISMRFKSDDHFWFTFFHEIGHLILHRDVELFLENENGTFPDKETEANEFAQNILIPENYRDEFLNLNPRYKDVLKFSRKIRLAPGVVVGQMQHFGILERSWLNKCKRRFSEAQIQKFSI